MFNNLKRMLGNEVSGLEDPDMMFPEEEMEEDDRDPEMILNDPASSFEQKKIAMQMVKDKYLKPQDNDE